MFRFHSNGCDRNDDRQACHAVQRNLSALQATEDALPGVRVALYATRRVDRPAANHQDRENEDQQGKRVGGDGGRVDVMPDVMKKMGISRPKARPSSLCSSDSSPSGSARRRTNLRRMHQARHRDQKAMARAPRLISSSKTRRTVICSVVSELPTIS
jgi:hypothetical protein